MTDYLVFDFDGRLMFTADGRFKMESDVDGPIELRAPNKLCCPCPPDRTCLELSEAWAANLPVTCVLASAMVNMPNPTAAGCGPPYAWGWTMLWNAQTITLTPDGFVGHYKGTGVTTFLNPLTSYSTFVSFRVLFACGNPFEHPWVNCNLETVPARENPFAAAFEFNPGSLQCVKKEGLMWNANFDVRGNWEFDDGQTSGSRCCNNLDLAPWISTGEDEISSVPISFTW